VIIEILGPTFPRAPSTDFLVRRITKKKHQSPRWCGFATEFLLDVSEVVAELGLVTDMERVAHGSLYPANSSHGWRSPRWFGSPLRPDEKTGGWELVLALVPSAGRPRERRGSAEHTKMWLLSAQP